MEYHVWGLLPNKPVPWGTGGYSQGEIRCLVAAPKVSDGFSYAFLSAFVCG